MTDDKPIRKSGFVILVFDGFELKVRGFSETEAEAAKLAENEFAQGLQSLMDEDRPKAYVIPATCFSKR